MMKRRFLGIAIVLLLTVPLSASFYSFEQVTVANSSIGFTATKITPTDGTPPRVYADCRLETAEIRYTVDGQTTPTTTVGQLLEIGDRLVIARREEMVNFRAIRTGGTSGTLSCYYSAP